MYKQTPNYVQLSLMLVSQQIPCNDLTDHSHIQSGTIYHIYPTIDLNFNFKLFYDQNKNDSCTPTEL